MILLQWVFTECRLMDEKSLGKRNPLVLAADGLADLPGRVLAWWDAGHEPFPWRQTTDPYAIWVSEIMLQQTRAPTVVRYYERWMAQFPTVTDLAEASLTAVLKTWEGMGYYARARNLHRAALQLIERYGRHLPADPQQLQSLPGIGRYTAGAIASIAFGQRVAVLDGNVVRVLARLIDLEVDVTRAATREGLWALASALVSATRPGEYNQALMELGRTVCRPARPDCVCCPLESCCLARAQGSQLERPVRPARKRTAHHNVTAAVIWGDPRPGVNGDQPIVLIARRPANAMLGGMWKFPGGKQREGESLAECLQREIREELDFKVSVDCHLVTIEHAYTHFRISLHAFHCHPVNGEPRPVQVADLRWVTLAELAEYPFPVTDQKIIAALAQSDR